MDMINKKIQFISVIVLLIFFTVPFHPVLAENSVTVSGKILPSVGPVAAFSGSPVTGIAPLMVKFTDQSEGRITSRTWDFTNDGITDSTTKNPTYRFTKAGNYSVRLTVNGPDGGNSLVKNNYITVVTAVKRPEAQFTRNPWIGPSPLMVKFTDHSQNNPVTYLWIFGDGSTSSEKNPVHTYTNAGVYLAQLTVSNQGGQDSLSRVVIVYSRWF